MNSCIALFKFGKLFCIKSDEYIIIYCSISVFFYIFLCIYIQYHFCMPCKSFVVHPWVLFYQQSIQLPCKSILIMSTVEVIYIEFIFMQTGVICVHFFIITSYNAWSICRHNCSGLCNMCIFGIENSSSFMLHRKAYLIFHLVKDLLICNLFCLIKLLRRAFLEQNSLHVRRMV